MVYWMDFQATIDPKIDEVIEKEISDSQKTPSSPATEWRIVALDLCR